MSFGGFAFSWIDVAVVALLGVGMYRGRCRGMSEELLDVLQWLAIVVVAGMVYQPAGRFVSDFTHLGRVTSYITVYVSVLISIRLVFGWIKRMVGEKLLGSDIFGSSEYYLGMGAGAVRFACYILVGMALLNAKYISPEQLAAEARMQKENFGDISFPTLGSLQQTVFKASVSGIFVKRYLGHELIVTTAADRSAAPAETLGRARERAVYEVLGERR